MTRRAVAFLALAALAAGPGRAECAVLSVGGRAGIAGYSGDVLFRSGDVGSDLVLGAHVQLAFLPRLALEGSAEYFATTFEYETAFEGLTLSREVDFRDLALYATVKLSLDPLPLVPLRPYVGGGAGLHLLTTEIVREEFSGAEHGEPPEEILEDAARGGFHLVAGLDAGGFLVPLGVFVEARYSRIGSDPEISAKSALAGLRFGF